VPTQYTYHDLCPYQFISMFFKKLIIYYLMRNCGFHTTGLPDDLMEKKITLFNIFYNIFTSVFTYGERQARYFDAYETIIFYTENCHRGCPVEPLWCLRCIKLLL